MYKISSWNMIFILYPNDFWHERKIYNFDPFNALLAVATNIPVLLVTGFVVQGHISGFSCSSEPQAPQAPRGAPRKTPTGGAQRAGAAALARIEQQHRPKVQTSHDAIRNQGRLLYLFVLRNMKILVNFSHILSLCFSKARTWSRGGCHGGQSKEHWCRGKSDICSFCLHLAGRFDFILIQNHTKPNIFADMLTESVWK